MEEHILISDMKSQEEIDALCQEEEETMLPAYYYESGYCKKLKDGKILIAFGKNAKQTIDKFE